MKKIFLTLLCAAALFSAACSDDSAVNNVNYHTINFEGPEWSQFVSAKSYSGDVMTEDYIWEDATTTLTLRPVFPDMGYGKFYGGGATLSNLSSNDLAGKGSYEYDLYAYNPSSADSTQGGGADGSNNFLVFFSNDESIASATGVDCRPSIYFRDGKARLIKGCKINSTTYFVNIVENGNEFSPKLAEGDEVKVYATGFDYAGNTSGTITFTLATYGSTVKEWTAWDLSSLGEVVKVQFDILGGPETEWGMTTPKYFALDDLTIEWTKER